MSAISIRNLVRPLSLTFVLLVALEPVFTARGYSYPLADVSLQANAGFNSGYAAPAPQEGFAQAQGDELQPGQAAFNQIVKVSLQTAGWLVNKVSSQLDDGSDQPNANDLSRSGRWHIEALDEKGLPLALDGVLTFTVQTQARVSQGFTVIEATGLNGLVSASSTVTGTLSGSGVEASLDLATDVANSSEVSRQTTNLRVQVSRSGETRLIKSIGNTEAKLLAYNLGRQEITSSLERDGKRIEARQTATVRQFGHNESEIWLESSSLDNSTQKVPLLISQHLFQRIVADKATQYLDRFDMATLENSYTLKEPATLSVAAGGTPAYSLVLMGKDGAELKLGGTSRPPGLSSVLPGDRDNSDAFGKQPTSGRGAGALYNIYSAAYSVAAPLGQRRSGSRANGPTPEQREQQRVGGALAVGAAVAIGTVAAADYAAGQAAAEAAAALGGREAVTVAGEKAVETAAVAEATASGAGTLSGGYSSANLARNADPYFVYPDVRPNADAINPSPLQITRVTGGLVAGVPTIALSITATGTSTLTVQQENSPVYDDDPVPLVGGAAPAGSQTVGEWKWDQGRPYGAMQSHTQPLTGGPQMHYFIHASKPLAPRQDTNIIQYVYLDPKQMPREIYMQFYTGDGDGERRVYWGDDLVQTGGKRGTPSLYPMGALPAAGGWVRLQVPADKLGLVGSSVSGVLYGAYAGQTWWGPTTTSNRQLDSAPDGMLVQSPSAPLTTTHGSQIAFRLAAPARLSITVLNKEGQQVRSLVKDVEMQAGYRVATWDARDDSGADVADAPYRVQFSVAGKVVAEHGVTVTPLVADIETPGAFSLVRGDQVPVVGDAYGEDFSRYTLEYGEGLAPAKWQVIVAADVPVLRKPGADLRSFNPGNIADWNVGVDEYRPWKQPGLNGVYTLRLSVMGKDGREAVDTSTVIVGRLAHTPEGGTITSPDGKAKLSIPPLATTRAFSIMALVPLAQVEPGNQGGGNLPAGRAPAGDVYELFPADEAFRRSAMLELPYSSQEPVNHIGVMLGDGTPGGWRYIGGAPDPQHGVIRVPVADFGGSRALVGAFASDNFGQAPTDPAASSRLSMSDTLSAPSVVSSTAPVAFYSDMESSPGEWEALDVGGTRIERVEGPSAGLQASGAALKVSKLPEGQRLVRVRSTPYDAARYPIVSFDYRFPPDYAPDMLVRCNGVWWQVKMGANSTVSTGYFEPLYAPRTVADDAWHHYQVDLLALLKSAQHDAKTFQVDEIVLGQIYRTAYMQVEIRDSGEVGSAYYLDNFAAQRPTNASALTFSWTPPAGSAPTAYSYVLDQQVGTSPPETAGTTQAGATVSIPAGSPDGQWYFHLRAQLADGKWGAVTHLPLLVDRQAPQVGRPDPSPGGAGTPNLAHVPLVDSFGVDLDSLQVRIGGTPFTWAAASHGGLTYSPEQGLLDVYPQMLDPKRPAPANGRKVEMAVQELSDYAGNKLSAPFAWSYTSDQPQDAPESGFRQLTTGGGVSPAVSPDGSSVAFVSSRSGSARVWVMQAGDYGEKGGTPKLLTGSGAEGQEGQEGDPAWSPDAKMLAYVSDATGSPQVWKAAPDGAEAQAITTGEGGAASPTWLTGGQKVAFIRDGNLWEVRADGTGLRAMTSYPEKPLRSVRSQPGGSLLTVGFKLYQETVELYDPATNLLQPLTGGGTDKQPAWLDSQTVMYAAPKTGDNLDAIWQVDAQAAGSAGGNKGTVMQNSGQSGAADMQPDASLDGSLVAIVSTREGERNVWLRQLLQLSSPRIEPASASPGENVAISYTLPASATVTLQLESGDGKAASTLTKEEAQAKGVQRITWAGTGSDGAPLAPGDYIVNLSAKIGAVTLQRRAALRMVAPDDKGTLRLDVQQWRGQAVRYTGDLSVLVYPEGTRSQPVARADDAGSPSFTLPAGRYDAVAEYEGTRVEARGLAVSAGRETAGKIDLGLGGLDLTLLMAQGQPLAGDAYVAVFRSGESTNTPLLTTYKAAPSFVLPPGKYDVHVEFGNVSKLVRGVLVKPGQATAQDISLEGGVLQLTVFLRDGEPARGKGWMTVQVLDSKDHKQVGGNSYDNPSKLVIPAGSYDVKITYGVTAAGEDGRYVGGQQTAMLTGIDIQAGQTVTKEQNLRLTPVTLHVLEAAGKRVEGDKVTVRLYSGSDRANSVAYSYTDTLQLELSEGAYEAVVSYYGTELGSGPAGAPINVMYAHPVDRTINLGLGHIKIEAYDDRGKLVDGSGLSAVAYPSGQHGIRFSSSSEANPLNLAVRGDTPYDIELRMSDGKITTWKGQQVKEGEVLTLKVTPSGSK